MKILRAWIDDPTELGTLQQPLMIVEVDEYPDQTHDPISTDDGWTQSKFGPFVKYDYSPTEEADAGDYNVRFAGQYPAIIDIGLMVLNFDDRSDIFGLPIPRARQLIRKHSPGWRLYLSDYDAIDGALLWVPQQVNATCRFWHPNARMTCDAPATATVRKSGVDLPLCVDHLKTHNSERAEARRASVK